MPKKEDIPVCPPTPKTQPPGKIETYSIRLITPMFGGGVETRTNDSDFPIRPTSIRGQLQFWWRATVGAQYETLKALREAQSKIWGSTDKASSVQVQVKAISVDQPQPCATYQKEHQQYKSTPNWNTLFQKTQKTKLPYALFPFQGKLSKDRTIIEEQPASCILQASFELTLRCPPKMWEEIEPAVWAWVNFGGLGSRTRRGCGALYCERLAPRDKADLAAQWKRYMPKPKPYPQREWPTLAETILVQETPDQPLQAWSQIIERFQYFRQEVNFARDPGKPAGRSRYPEPDTIRRITGAHSNGHDPRDYIPDAFPRAEFGLPIVFHFKKEGRGNPPDPADTVLYPCNDAKGEKRERMASPLILKPLALLGGQQAVPLVIRLKTPLLEGVDLRIKANLLSSLPEEVAKNVRTTMKPNDQEGSLPLPASTVIRGARLSTYRNSPLQGSPNGFALEAFLSFVRNEGYTEVTP